MVVGNDTKKDLVIFVLKYKGCAMSFSVHIGKSNICPKQTIKNPGMTAQGATTPTRNEKIAGEKQYLQHLIEE